MKSLILLAIQGTGKGTLASMLQEKYGYAHISTGDILRARVAVGDELGLKIKSLIDNGILVSNDIIYEAIEYRITQDDCKNGYILDGFPRTLEQAKGYDEMLNKLGTDKGIALYLTVDEEVMLERIATRRTCKNCGKIYNTKNPDMFSKVEGICDVCQGEIIHRDDDKDPEAVKKRIETSKANIQDILDFYEDKGLLHTIDFADRWEGLKNVEDILNNLGDSIDNN